MAHGSGDDSHQGEAGNNLCGGDDKLTDAAGSNVLVGGASEGQDNLKDQVVGTETKTTV